MTIRRRINLFVHRWTCFDDAVIAALVQICREVASQRFYAVPDHRPMKKGWTPVEPDQGWKPVIEQERKRKADWRKKVGL